MTAKHTPGPWFGLIDGKYNNSKNNWRAADEEAGCSQAAPITTQDGTVIALVVASGDAYFDEDRVSDNAHLIAAAPDLLEACKKALSIIGFGIEYDIINSAIAKATGGQQ